MDPWVGVRTLNVHHGNVLRAVRVAAGVKQAALVRQLDPNGEFADITIPNISRIENGLMIPSPTMAKIIHRWILQQPQSDEVIQTWQRDRNE